MYVYIYEYLGFNLYNYNLRIEPALCIIILNQLKFTNRVYYGLYICNCIHVLSI